MTARTAAAIAAFAAWLGIGAGWIWRSPVLPQHAEPSATDAGSSGPDPDTGSALATAFDLDDALAGGTGFVEGDGGPLVTAFIDLACGFCGELYARSRAPVARGELRVRWLPVAVLGVDSFGRAAAVLQAADRSQALAAAHRHRLAAAAPTAAVRDGIATNNAMLSMLTSGRIATPLVVARGADGSVRARIGVPADLVAFAATP